ncbi:MAG: hypothetical protein Q9209_005597 [Squamulea sp. 1 TL-2023]
MFDDYSIAGASQPHRTDKNYSMMMDDDISPTSSRTTTPSPEDMSIPQSPPAMDSLTELSYRLKQHTLGEREHQSTHLEPLLLSPASLDVEPPTSSARTRRRRSSSLLIWQQRQALTRRQCTLSHLSHISALVEELSQNVNKPDYDATHPSSTYRSPVSPTSNPSSFASFNSTPSSSGSEDCGSGTSCAPSKIMASKVGKEWRRGASCREATERKKKLVMKKIRMRRSLVRLRMGE